MSEVKTFISRKGFLKKLTWLAFLPYLLFFYLMTRKNSQLVAPNVIRLPIPEVEGIYFHGELIIIKEAGTIRVMSSRCPHLGCRISKLQNGNLICPCHGSTFTPDGSVLSGPASKHLPTISFRFDEQSNEIIIYL